MNGGYKMESLSDASLSVATLYTKFALSPILVLLGIGTMIACFRLRKVYKIDLSICIVVFLAGLFILAYAIADFILSPVANIIFAKY
jgi:hypothetical protein